MATNIIVGPLAGSIIVSEATMWRSRDEVLVAIDADGVKSGTLLKAGATAADPLVPIAAVGDTPVAVMLNDHYRDDPAVAQAQKCTVLARDCELRGNGLIMPDGANNDQKIALGAKLATAGVVVRW